MITTLSPLALSRFAQCLIRRNSIIISYIVISALRQNAFVLSITMQRTIFNLLI